MVFNIFHKLAASISSLVGTGTLSTGYKVLQGTNPLCKGYNALQVGLGGINEILWVHYKSKLASMTISSTISHLVSNDNNSFYPYMHSPLLY